MATTRLPPTMEPEKVAWAVLSIRPLPDRSNLMARELMQTSVAPDPTPSMKVKIDNSIRPCEMPGSTPIPPKQAREITITR